MPARISPICCSCAARDARADGGRLSIGASRSRLIGQLLLESVVLALAGAALGLLVSRWTLDTIAAQLPPEAVATIDFTIDRTVMLFAGTLAIATGLLFGLFPALHSTRPTLVAALREDAGQKGAARGASRFRTTLATAQIALSMALLVSAGLFVRSLINVSRVDLGINTDNLVMFAISPQLNGYTPERSRALFERVEDELMALPGVTSVSASTCPLISGSNWGSSVSVQGFQAGPDTDTHSNFNRVGPDYFRTLGVPLVAGREFTRADTLSAGEVVLVNEAFARKFNPGPRRRRQVHQRQRRQQREARHGDRRAGPRCQVRRGEAGDATGVLPPLPAGSASRLHHLLCQNSAGPEQLMPSINSAIARLDPNLPVENLKTVDQQIRENVFLDRIISTLSAAFATLATVLAAVGLYGVLAYTVAQRTREIGVRMALGADGGRVRGMVLRQVALMMVVGGALGLAGAIALGRGAESLLFQMKGSDPVVLASAAVLLVLVALAAGFVPAQRRPGLIRWWLSATNDGETQIPPIRSKNGTQISRFHRLDGGRRPRPKAAVCRSYAPTLSARPPAVRTKI